MSGEDPAPPATAPSTPAFSEDRVPAIRTVAMPSDLNPGGGIFGGWLLGQLDQAAGIAAWRRAEGRCVSASMQMSFDAPIAVGDEVSLFAEIRGQGHSSFRIGVDAWARARTAGSVRLVGRAEFVYVAVDDEGRPRPLK